MRLDKFQNRIFNTKSEADASAFVIRCKPESSIVMGEDTVIVESFVRNSSIYHSKILTSAINRSTVFRALVLNAQVVDSFIGEGSVVEGNIKQAQIGKGAVIGDEAWVDSFTVPDCAQILRGYWTRPPIHIDDPGLQFNVTESTDDNILIGCYERPGNKWLKTSQQAFQRIGVPMEDWLVYKHIVESIMEEKLVNPSPRGFRK